MGKRTEDLIDYIWYGFVIFFILMLFYKVLFD